MELAWETTGYSIDYFILKSRLYQSGNKFNQIERIDGAEGSASYQYNDEQASPGLIYEYQLIGVVDCADALLTTDTLYTYGFRTPTGDIYGRVTFESGQAEKDVEVRLETDEGIPGQSLLLDNTQFAKIEDSAFLQNCDTAITLHRITSYNVCYTKLLRGIYFIWFNLFQIIFY